MSLRLWFPLNGNFNNQGLDGPLNFTITGTVTDTAGKIGQSKEFSLSNVIAPYNFTLGTEASFCCWIYFNEFPSSSQSNDWIFHIGSQSGYANAVLGLSSTSAGKFVIMVGGKSDSNNTHNFELNTWHHIAFTWNNSIGKLYFDGQYKKSFTNLNGGTVKTGTKFSLGSNVANGSTKLKGRLNDVRIYDHCLSAKEVEEISKGLLLHYKLDNILNNDNNIYDCSGFGNNGIIVGETYNISNDTAKYLNSISLPNDNWIRVLKHPGITCSKDAITVNIWAKINASWTYNRGSIISCQEGSGWAIAKASDNLLYFEVYADGAYRIAKASETSYTSALIGNWHMLTGTADRTTIKLYFDGELIATGENTATTDFRYISNYIFIGGDAKGANNETPYSAINGLFSDCRIYATVLTEAQIKELYNTSSSIDNKQNFYGRELIESNSQQINKKGQTLANTFNENNTQVNICKSGAIEAIDLYEY